MMDAKISNSGIGGGIFDLLAGSQVMSPSVGAFGQQAAAGESGAAFGNLLDLVSDMQLADEQGPMQADFLAQQSAGLNDPALTALAAGAAQSAWADPLAKTQLLTAEKSVVDKSATDKGAMELKSGVGHLAAKAGETPSASELLLGAEVTARAGSLAKAQAAPPVDAASARMWAMALATGDIKTVSVDKADEAPVAKPLPMGALLGLEKPQAAVAAQAPAKEAPVNAALKAELTPETAVSRAESPAPKPVAPAHRAAEPAAERAEPVANRAAAPAPSASVATKAEPAAREPGGFQPFVAEVRGKASEDKPAKKAVNGSEFLLDRVAEAPVKAQASGLVAADKLGQQGDTRVSSQSLDFVADKVDSLRQQGGGKLRVELNPGHLGSVEIRVSTVRGLMKVEVLAEKPETVKALTDSKAELVGKLEAIAPSKLDVGALSAPRAQAGVAASNATTGELLNLRASQGQAEGARVVSNVAGNSMAGSSGGSGERSNNGASSERSSDWMSQRDQSQQQGQQREERRERARREWEDFSQERKSA